MQITCPVLLYDSRPGERNILNAGVQMNLEKSNAALHLHDLVEYRLVIAFAHKCRSVIWNLSALFTSLASLLAVSVQINSVETQCHCHLATATSHCLVI